MTSPLRGEAPNRTILGVDLKHRMNSADISPRHATTIWNSIIKLHTSAVVFGDFPDFEQEIRALFPFEQPEHRYGKSAKWDVELGIDELSRFLPNVAEDRQTARRMGGVSLQGVGATLLPPLREVVAAIVVHDAYQETGH